MGELEGQVLGSEGCGTTYLAVCSSEKYLEGILVLDQSLRRVRSTHPLTVLVTSAVPSRVERTLQRMGIPTVRLFRSIDVPREIVERNAASGQAHWSQTFDKLQIFELPGFRKVVYLDSDMLVLRNVDELFDRPHLAAVAAGRSQPGNESWDRLNSGCLVVVPEAGAVDRLWAAVPKAMATRDAVGDQDLIQIAHPEWPDRPDLHLGEEYNLFFVYLEHYTRALGYSLRGDNPIKIVHFVGADKPWTMSLLGATRTLVRHLRAGQWASFEVLARYESVLLRARVRLLAHAVRGRGHR